MISISEHLKIKVQNIYSFLPFTVWKTSLDKLVKETPKISYEKITVTDVDYFGDRIGFMKVSADAKWEDNTRIPSIAFLRGGSVAILVILKTPNSTNDSNDAKVILVNQLRLAAGKFMLELPAGMLDSSGDFSGIAAQELKEECGIDIRKEELIDMTELAYGENDAVVYTSPGASDEFLKIFCCQKIMSMNEISDLKSHLGGLREDGERIQLKIVDLKDLVKETRDMKVLAAVALFQSLDL